MSKIGLNIKKIRSVKKLNQTAFAEKFGLSRTSVGAYEEGRAEPKIDTIIQIAEHFGINLDHLIRKEITVNQIHHFNIFDNKIANKKDNKSSNDESNANKIRLIEFETMNKYATQPNKIDFETASISFPGMHSDFHRAFQIEKDKIVIAKKSPVSNLQTGKNYLFFFNEKYIVYKLIETKKTDFIVNNLNQDIQLLEKKNIIEVWELTKVILDYQTNNLEERVSQIEKRLKRLETKEEC